MRFVTAPALRHVLKVQSASFCIEIRHALMGTIDKMQLVITENLEDLISLEAIKLFTPQELDSLKQWFRLLRQVNITKQHENMLCIPPKSKELDAAVKRVARILTERHYGEQKSAPITDQSG